MREHGITPPIKRKFRKTTDSDHRHAVAPNLLDRDFTALSHRGLYQPTFVEVQERVSFSETDFDGRSNGAINDDVRRLDRGGNDTGRGRCLGVAANYAPARRFAVSRDPFNVRRGLAGRSIILNTMVTQANYEPERFVFGCRTPRPSKSGLRTS